MVKIVIMDEITLRLSTPDNEEFIQADEFGISYGGGEANVVASLANYGYEAELTTAVPANPIGECAVAASRKYSVDTKHTVRSGERPGICFLETGFATRASNMIYGHVHNSISIATADQFNFDEIFADVDWFYFTGITPAVSDAVIESAEITLKAVKAHNVTVSANLNSRKELWSSEKVQKVITNLIQYVDACIGNEENVEKVLGLKPGNTDVTSGGLELARCVNISNQMTDKFGFKYIISFLRESHSASNDGWSACIVDGEAHEFYRSGKYHITLTADRVDDGDSSVAGLIYGLVDDKDMKAALEYAVTASVLKHTIPDDLNLVTRTDVRNLTDGDGLGRIQR